MFTLFPDKYSPAVYCSDDDAPESTWGVVVEDITGPHRTDAHYYPVVVLPYPAFPRLGKTAKGNAATRNQILQEVPDILVTHLVADVDCDYPDWRAREREKILALDPIPGYYFTRGGYRLLWRYPEPVSPLVHEVKVQEMIRYLDSQGIVADPACKEWTRLFRAPNTTRDGRLEEYEVHLGAIPLWGHRGLFAGIGAVKLPLRPWESFGPIPKGKRNATLFAVACKYVGAGFAEDEVRAQIIRYHDRWCSPPLARDELEAVLASAMRYDAPADPIPSEVRDLWAAKILERRP